MNDNLKQTDVHIKYESELSYWKNRFVLEGNNFNNQHYKALFLGLANEKNDNFLKDKIIADFGCGPRGSLAWTDIPKEKIGIDVLSTTYFDTFGDELLKHNMLYLSSTENYIPIPTNYVDILTTINSIDHVNNLEKMATELFRILKPGGMFLASFNLNEAENDCEPQNLNEYIIDKLFLQNLNILSYKLAYKDSQDTYKNFFENNILKRSKNINKPIILWIKGLKK